MEASPKEVQTKLGVGVAKKTFGGDITITITKWAEYNPKRDQKKYTWARVENSLLTGPKLWSFESDEKLLWIFLICEASAACDGEKDGTFELNISRASDCLKIKSAKILVSLDHFQQKQMLTWDARPQATADDRARPQAVANVRTYEQTNDTNVRTEPRASAQDLVSEKPKTENLISGVKECVDAWIETLRFHKSLPPSGNLPHGTDSKIARMIQAKGHESVLLALLGARVEPPGEKYDPTKHLSIARVFDPLKFDRFVVLGSQEENKKRERAATAEAIKKAKVQISTDESEPQEPERELTPQEIEANKKRIRELMGRAVS